MASEQTVSSQGAYADKPASYFGHARTDIAPLLPGTAGAPLGRVLELGCGSGGTMAWLRSVRTVADATGIELMPDSAAVARAHFDRVITGSIDDPAIPGALPPVDLILALDVLEHLADPAAAVRKLVRLLVPGGAFIASLPQVAHYSVALPLLFGGRWTYREEGLLDRTHLRFFDAAGARALLADNGLAIDRMVWRDEAGFLGVLFRHSALLRWYGLRALQCVLPGHLLHHGCLIRGRAAG
jgi:SAM-dependent methyltransferase